MKTQLPNSISTVDEAKKFLKELYDNGESFHPQDNANDLVGDPFTKYEGDRLNDLMDEIYELPDNSDSQNMAFDPCEFLLMQDADYVAEIKANDPEWYNEVAPRYGLPI